MTSDTISDCRFWIADCRLWRSSAVEQRCACNLLNSSWYETLRATTELAAAAQDWGTLTGLVPSHLSPSLMRIEDHPLALETE